MVWNGPVYKQLVHEKVLWKTILANINKTFHDFEDIEMINIICAEVNNNIRKWYINNHEI